jgi:hypothetical protein
MNLNTYLDLKNNNIRTKNILCFGKNILLLIQHVIWFYQKKFQSSDQTEIM